MPEPTEPTARWLRAAFAVAALAFVAAGISHVVRGLAPPANDTSSPTRHAVFVLINALAAAGVLTRPRWFALPFAALTLQQLLSHGAPAASALAGGAAPALDDAAVALAMPAILALLVVDLRRRGPAPTGA